MLKLSISISEIDYVAVANAVPSGVLPGLDKLKIPIVPASMKESGVVDKLREGSPQHIKALNWLLKKLKVKAVVSAGSVVVERRRGGGIEIRLRFVSVRR